MATINHADSNGTDFSFNTGDVTINAENDEPKHSTKGEQHTADTPANRASTTSVKDKGAQYLVLSVVGYLCASIIFGFLLNKKQQESKA